MTEPRTIELCALVEELCAIPSCSMGGPLHIVVDDLNVEDSNLDFCERELRSHWSIDEAEPTDRERIRKLGSEIIALIRALPVEERIEALR